MTLVVATLAGEIGIKGRATRSHMVRELVKNVSSVVNVRSWRALGGLLVLDVDGDPAALSRVFGIAHFAVAQEVRYDDLNDLVAKAEQLVEGEVRGRKFAVRARRVGEDRFTSLDVQRALGDALRPHSAGVDLSSPEVTVNVYIWGRGLAYVYVNQFEGARGLPVGVAGKTVSLVSGGIDSPVATWMIMRRGVVPVVLNLALGTDAQVRAVLDEVRVLRAWSGAHDIRVHVVEGAPVLASMSAVRPHLRVVVLKRVMLRLAEALARRVRAHSITTGESLSQVSSQTMWNLEAEQRGIGLPVLRPLIAMEKDEIVEMARRVGTYDISAKVPEYCAIASSSTTRATPEEVDEAEASMGLDYVKLVEGSREYVVRAGGVVEPAGRGVRLKSGNT